MWMVNIKLQHVISLAQFIISYQTPEAGTPLCFHTDKLTDSFVTGKKTSKCVEMKMF